MVQLIQNSLLPPLSPFYDPTRPRLSPREPSLPKSRQNERQELTEYRQELADMMAAAVEGADQLAELAESGNAARFREFITGLPKTSNEPQKNSRQNWK